MFTGQTQVAFSKNRQLYLLNVAIFVLVPLFKVPFISIFFFLQISVSGYGGIALNVLFLPVTHANRVPLKQRENNSS